MLCEGFSRHFGRLRRVKIMVKLLKLSWRGLLSSLEFAEVFLMPMVIFNIVA